MYYPGPSVLMSSAADKKFIEIFDGLARELDLIGLYITDLSMIIVDPKQRHMTDLEKLRKLAAADEVTLLLDVECFAGNAAWRDTNNMDWLYSNFDIENYFK